MKFKLNNNEEFVVSKSDCEINLSGDGDLTLTAGNAIYMNDDNGNDIYVSNDSHNAGYINGYKPYVLTQNQYNAIQTKDNNTIYIIKG